jgi:hypothetical protein
MDSVVCDNCNQTFDCKPQSGRSFSIVYCAPCRKIRSKDLVEIILPKDFSPKGVSILLAGEKTIIFQEYEVVQAETMIRTFLNADVRLDLHKTLDTVSPETTLYTTVAPKSTCCLSYVGQCTSTRVNARMDIINRINTGQLLFGALVFKRGRDNTPFVDVGGKAWFNSVLPSTNSPLFVDDSIDHVLSVKYVNITSIQKTPQKSLLKLIN